MHTQATSRHLSLAADHRSSQDRRNPRPTSSLPGGWGHVREDRDSHGFSRIEAVSAGTHGLLAIAGWDRPWVRGRGLAVLAGFGRCCGFEFVVE